MYSSSGRREKAVEKLLHGHGCAHRLKAWFDSNSNASVPVGQLSSAIFDSFSDALSIVLDADLSQDTITSLPNHQPRCSTYNNTTASARNGNAEERVEFWRDDSPVPIYHDGFIWRKYGQKDIKHSKHQRSYYRCTYGEVCKAKKHVQKIQDNPAVYRTTYFGQHRCQNQLSNLQILSGDESAGSGTILSFDNHDHHHHHLPSASSVNNNHQEHMKGRQELWYPPSPGTMMFESPAAFIDLEDVSDSPLILQF